MKPALLTVHGLSRCSGRKAFKMHPSHCEDLKMWKITGESCGVLVSRSLRNLLLC